MPRQHKPLTPEEKERKHRRARERYAADTAAARKKRNAAYAANKEKRCAYQKAWNAKHPGLARAYRAKTIAKYGDRYAMKKRESVAADYADPIRYIILKVRSAKERSRRKGMPFNIDESDVHIPTHCPVFGTPLTFKQNRDNSPALDRLNNGKGYVKGNVAIISQRANACKRDMTVDECRKLLAYMEAAELSS